MPRDKGRPASDGWYDRASGEGLLSPEGKPASMFGSAKRTVPVLLRGPGGPDGEMVSSTSRRMSLISVSPDSWLALKSSTRGPSLALEDRLESVTDGLAALDSGAGAALAKRCLAASNASFALLRAEVAYAGLVGEVLSVPVNRRIVAPLCGWPDVGVSSSS